MNNITKGNKRGRKPGVSSFASITLAELTNQLAATANIVVSSKWLISVGLKPDAFPVANVEQAAPLSINLKISDPTED